MSSPAIRRITQAGVVGALALGVSGVVVMDKSVALSVDGEKSTVHAFGGTVGDVLDKQGIEYEVVDITQDADARDYVMALGYLQAPVVVADDEHWSGFRLDRIKALATRAA